MGQNVQRGARGAADSFNRFVEGTGAEHESKVDPDKKDFWDSFGSPTEDSPPVRVMGAPSGGGMAGGTAKKPSAIGTAAMKKAGGDSGGAAPAKDEWADDF